MIEDFAWHSKRIMGRLRRIAGSIAVRGWRGTLARMRDAIASQSSSSDKNESGSTRHLDNPMVPVGKRMLVVDTCVPVPSRDSGSLRLLTLLTLLREEGWHIDFFADDDQASADSIRHLHECGIQMPRERFLTWLRRQGMQLDAVMLCRVPVAAQYGSLVRRHAPRATLVFDTVDLHFLRESRAARVLGRKSLQRRADDTRRKELSLIKGSDICLVVSHEEQRILGELLPGTRVELLSNIHEVHGRLTGFDARRDLVFVGGFRHPPNLDGMRWFVEAVLPLLRRQEPTMTLHVIGELNGEAERRLRADGVILHGRIEDIAPFMNGARVSVAPLRFGAGVKGKVNMAMSYGLPVVATTTAAEGMHLQDGVDVLIADSAPDFADAVLRAYRTQSLWEQLSDGGLANVRANFSVDVARRTVQTLLPACDRPGHEARECC